MVEQSEKKCLKFLDDSGDGSLPGVFGWKTIAIVSCRQVYKSSGVSIKKNPGTVKISSGI